MVYCSGGYIRKQYRKEWNNMKKWKRILSVVLASVLILSLCACGKDAQSSQIPDDINNISDEINASKGRYMETAVSAPGGEHMAMGLLEDGTLRMVTTTGIFDSKDDGLTWNPWEHMTPELSADFSTAHNETYDFEYDKIVLAAVSPGGNIFYGVHEAENTVYKILAFDGISRELHISLTQAPEDESSSSSVTSGGKNRLREAAFAPNGDLLCTDYRQIYQIDTETLTVKHQYDPLAFDGQIPENAPAAGEPQDDFVSGGFRFVVAGQKLFAILEEYEFQPDGNTSLVDSTVVAYNLDTFASEEEVPILQDFLMSAEGGRDELEKIFLSSADGKSLYIANPTGVYRYRTEGTAVEKIFSGSLGKMSAPMSMLCNGIVINEEKFMLYYRYDESLVCYSYDPNAPSTPEKTLTIYSLYDNTDIRQVISSYQTEHPNVMVELETGIEKDGGITRTDALKTLNTNIMAGDGPDLLMLDGMPVDAYIEKGLLMDISSVISEVQTSQSLFENIVTAYQKGDTIAAVPTRFTVPVIYGKQKLLAQAKTLTELADVMERLRQEQPDKTSIIGSLSPSLLLLMLLPASSPAWIREDGTLDPDLLQQFIEDMKRIADAQNCPDSFAYPLEEGELLDLSPFMCSTEFTVTEMGYADAHMSLGHIRFASDLLAMESLLSYLGDGSYQQMPGQAAHTFVPISPVGVNAKGNEPELAKDFVNFLLTDAQSLSGAAGLPVNKNAFDRLKEVPDYHEDELRRMTSEDGNGYFEMNYTWPSNQKFDALQEKIESLTTPALTDELIIRTVFEEVNRCLDGETSVSDTADTIVKKVNLYLAE